MFRIEHRSTCRPVKIVNISICVFDLLRLYVINRNTIAYLELLSLFLLMCFSSKIGNSCRKLHYVWFLRPSQTWFGHFWKHQLRLRDIEYAHLDWSEHDLSWLFRITSFPNLLRHFVFEVSDYSSLNFKPIHIYDILPCSHWCRLSVDVRYASLRKAS